ncbi:MAG TPA: hypothetical protein VHM19_08945 [Polyangiales bacterium]|jgi:hypothetical protein|nr:hypothetical protein [Polyangiales bacterium]
MGRGKPPGDSEGEHDDSGDRGGNSLGFGLSFHMTCSCARCGRPRELPSAGGKHPMGSGGTLFVNADTPCGCGAGRIRITFDVR